MAPRRTKSPDYNCNCIQTVNVDDIRSIIAVHFPFYVRKATSDHDPFTLYVFCILRGQFRLNIQTCVNKKNKRNSNVTRAAPRKQKTVSLLYPPTLAPTPPGAPRHGLYASRIDANGQLTLHAGRFLSARD